jgi:hypothetical protein
MGRLCTVCTHPEREDIDTALLAHSQSYQQIAARFGMPVRTLHNHEEAHLALTLAESKEVGRMLSAETLMARLSDLEAHTRRALDYAEETGDLKALAVFIVISWDNLEAFLRFAPYVNAKTVPAQITAPFTGQQPSAETMRQVLRTMIDAGMAMAPSDLAEPADADIDEEARADVRPA